MVTHLRLDKLCRCILYPADENILNYGSWDADSDPAKVQYYIFINKELLYTGNPPWPPLLSPVYKWCLLVHVPLNVKAVSKFSTSCAGLQETTGQDRNQGSAFGASTCCSPVPAPQENWIRIYCYWEKEARAIADCLLSLGVCHGIVRSFDTWGWYIFDTP